MSPVVAKAYSLDPRLIGKEKDYHQNSTFSPPPRKVENYLTPTQRDGESARGSPMSIDEEQSFSMASENSEAMEQFEKFVAEMDAGDLKSFEITKGTASDDGTSLTIKGKAKNSEGKGRQVTIGIAKEGEGYGMSYFRVRTFGTSGLPPVKDPEAATKLATGTLQRVADSIASGNFGPYLDEISVIHRQTFGDDVLVAVAQRCMQSGPPVVERPELCASPEQNVDDVGRASLPGDGV